MTTVWIVDEQDYDSYTFHGVFSTEAMANAHADEVDGSVSEHTVQDEAPYKVDYWLTRANKANNGTWIVTNQKNWTWSYWEICALDAPTLVRTSCFVFTLDEATGRSLVESSVLKAEPEAFIAYQGKS